MKKIIAVAMAVIAIVTSLFVVITAITAATTIIANAEAASASVMNAAKLAYGLETGFAPSSASATVFSYTYYDYCNGIIANANAAALGILSFASVIVVIVIAVVISFIRIIPSTRVGEFRFPSFRSTKSVKSANSEADEVVVAGLTVEFFDCSNTTKATWKAALLKAMTFYHDAMPEAYETLLFANIKVRIGAGNTKAWACHDSRNLQGMAIHNSTSNKVLLKDFTRCACWLVAVHELGHIVDFSTFDGDHKVNVKAEASALSAIRAALGIEYAEYPLDAQKPSELFACSMEVVALLWEKGEPWCRCMKALPHGCSAWLEDARNASAHGRTAIAGYFHGAYSTDIPEEVSEWLEEHPFTDKSFSFTAHALAAEWRQYDEALLPLRKPSRFNGAKLMSYRSEPSPEKGGKNWTVALRKSCRDQDYVIIASPRLDGTWKVPTYWLVQPGAAYNTDYLTGEKWERNH